jgi:hypothetical protein
MSVLMRMARAVSGNISNSALVIFGHASSIQESLARADLNFVTRIAATGRI